MCRQYTMGAITSVFSEPEQMSVYGKYPYIRLSKAKLQPDRRVSKILFDSGERRFSGVNRPRGGIHQLLKRRGPE